MSLSLTARAWIAVLLLAGCGGDHRWGGTDAAAADAATDVCTPGQDQTCNDDPRVSSLHGRCLANRTCLCGEGVPLNPATGRCR